MNLVEQNCQEHRKVTANLDSTNHLAMFLPREPNTKRQPDLPLCEFPPERFGEDYIVPDDQFKIDGTGYCPFRC
ncbi:hypothetical protein M8J75_008696 [Diaphorina citri]|nr:hypothetical protein M8J75_008696 [Diaphorina citri]